VRRVLLVGDETSRKAVSGSDAGRRELLWHAHLLGLNVWPWGGDVDPLVQACTPHALVLGCGVGGVRHVGVCGGCLVCGWVESLVVQDTFESCDGESNLV